jgi:hypothetical protein
MFLYSIKFDVFVDSCLKDIIGVPVTDAGNLKMKQFVLAAGKWPIILYFYSEASSLSRAIRERRSYNFEKIDDKPFTLCQ